MNDNGIPTTGDDAVQADFDWHFQRDKKVLFEIRIERKGRKCRVEVLVDLLRLKPKQELRLNEFLERRHKGQTLLIERVRTLGWVVDISLAQQHPELTEAERDAEVRRLLLCEQTQNKDESELTAKQAVFELRGQDWVNSTGDVACYRDCQELPRFGEIRAACLPGQERFDFGAPTVPTSSPAEQAQADMFFIELRHSPTPGAVQAKYNSLIHWHDQRWLDAIAETIKHRLKPEESIEWLDFHLLWGWMPMGLWGVRNRDRFKILAQVGITTTAEIIRKRVRHWKLLDWADFKKTYPSSPLEYVIDEFSDTGEKYIQMWIRPKYLKWLKD